MFTTKSKYRDFSFEKGAKIDDVDDVDKMENVCYYSVMQTS